MDRITARAIKLYKTTYFARKAADAREEEMNGLVKLMDAGRLADYTRATMEFDERHDIIHEPRETSDWSGGFADDH